MTCASFLCPPQPRPAFAPDAVCDDAFAAGQTFTVQCPKNCMATGGTASVWGAFPLGGKKPPFADISSICMAAIYVGAGSNDENFYATFKITKPVIMYDSASASKWE
jgi:hypothetical protein